jgi:hypothetical protein
VTAPRTPLVRLPTAAYQGQPVAPDAASRAAIPISEPYETDTRTVQLPSNTEVTLFRTKRRWRGIDIYMPQPLNTGPTGTARYIVYVYAISNGIRALIAQGVYQSQVDVGPKWIASARAIGDAFEVSAVFEPNSDSTSAPFQFSYLATDECLEETDRDVGVAQLATTLLVGSASFRVGSNVAFTPEAGPGRELVALNLVNRTAGVLWAQALDATAPFFGGGAPIVSFLLPAGGSVYETSKRLRDWRYKNGLVVAASTTPDTCTLAGLNDAGINFWYR